VSDGNLSSSLRLFSKENTGTIKGSYSEESSVSSEKIVVYAYKKGTFNASTETQGQTSDNIMFKNAVASAEVKQSLSGKGYTLAFLEEGEYELHFVGYSKSTESGRYVMTGRLQSETTVDGQVGSVVKVKAGVSVDISSSIKGVI
jgi:hypothetical protein